MPISVEHLIRALREHAFSEDSLEELLVHAECLMGHSQLSVEVQPHPDPPESLDDSGTATSSEAGDIPSPPAESGGEITRRGTRAVMDEVRTYLTSQESLKASPFRLAQDGARTSVIDKKSGNILATVATSSIRIGPRIKRPRPPPSPRQLRVERVFRCLNQKFESGRMRFPADISERPELAYWKFRQPP